MSENPQRRWLDRIASAPSLLTATTRMTGDIETRDALLLHGKIEGDGRIGGELLIAAGAAWHGNVQAGHANIGGTFIGALIVDGKLEILASALIRGRVSARQIAIAEGAVIEADVTVTSAEPIVRFTEKRGPP
jgi:cytoskeletal protein CcmA (bactofilin family)